MSRRRESETESDVTAGLKELWSGMVDTIGLELENRGLRRSLEMMLKGRDDERTAKGTREICLKAALETRKATLGYEDVEIFTDAEVLDTARKYETFINGCFIASELPTPEGDIGR